MSVNSVVVFTCCQMTKELYASVFLHLSLQDRHWIDTGTAMMVCVNFVISYFLYMFFGGCEVAQFYCQSRCQSFVSADAYMNNGWQE